MNIESYASSKATHRSFSGRMVAGRVREATGGSVNTDFWRVGGRVGGHRAAVQTEHTRKVDRPQLTTRALEGELVKATGAGSADRHDGNSLFGYPAPGCQELARPAWSPDHDLIVAGVQHEIRRQLTARTWEPAGELLAIRHGMSEIKALLVNQFAAVDTTGRRASSPASEAPLQTGVETGRPSCAWALGPAPSSTTSDALLGGGNDIATAIESGARGEMPAGLQASMPVIDAQAARRSSVAWQQQPRVRLAAARTAPPPIASPSARPTNEFLTPIETDADAVKTRVPQNIKPLDGHPDHAPPLELCQGVQTVQPPAPEITRPERAQVTNCHPCVCCALYTTGAAYTGCRWFAQPKTSTGSYYQWRIVALGQGVPGGQ